MHIYEFILHESKSMYLSIFAYHQTVFWGENENKTQ